MKIISGLIINIIFEICDALNFVFYNVIMNYLIHFLLKSEKKKCVIYALFKFEVRFNITYFYSHKKFK